MLRAHRPDMSRADRRARSGELLEMVGIPADRLSSYPHELSGGMRQRVMIAIALALDPSVVIMDEPTTALDVVTQREILEELMALRDRLGFAVLFISHDLSLLVEIADSIAVMYAGRLVERARASATVPGAAAPVHARPAELVPRPARAAPAMDGIPGSPPTCGTCRRAARSTRAAGTRSTGAAATRRRRCWTWRGHPGGRVLAAGRRAWPCRPNWRRPEPGRRRRPMSPGAGTRDAGVPCPRRPPLASRRPDWEPA